MKNKFLFLVSFMLIGIFSINAQTLIISEVADPGDHYEGRFVELYNATGSAINFDVTDWYLVKQSNGSGYSNVKLVGTVAAGATFTIGNTVANFNTQYGFNPDFFHGTVINGNGDDGYFLYLGGDETTGTLIDAYGVIDEDGSGKPWDYEDAHAVRNASIANANSTWTASEWTITDADVADMTPGVHGSTPSTAPSVTNIVIAPTAPTSADNVAISATVTDDGTIASVVVNWGTVSGTLSTTTNMSLVGGVYVTDTPIPAQLAGTTVYYEIVATDDTPEVTTTAEMSYDVLAVPGAVIPPYTRDFQTGDINTDGWSTELVTGTHDWFVATSGGLKYAKMSNYNSGNTASETWLISPEVDVTTVTDLTLKFDNAWKYTGDEMTLKVSTDYDGTNFATATWTDLTFTTSVNGNYEWVNSGNIDLTSYATGNNSLYIAFKYTGTDADGKTWQIDNFNLSIPVTVPVIENITHTPTTPTSVDVVEVSATITDNVAVTSANLYWSLTSPVTVADNSVAMVVGANDIYTASIPAQAETTTVYYMIVAADGEAVPNVTTSPENSYTVAADVPSLTITSPTDGATLTTSDVNIAFDVNFFDVQTPSAGDGYIVYNVDSGADVNYEVTTDIALTGLANGAHTVDMKLVDNTGADLSPAVTATVNFTVAVVSDVTIHDIQYTTVAGTEGTYPSLLVDQVVNTAGVVSAVGTGNYYIQDADGAWNGVFVYDNTNTPAIGDSIAITCTVAEYNGLTELKTVTAYEVKTSGETVHPAVAVTTLAANEEQYEGVLIKVTGATCTNDDTAGNFGMWEVNDNSGAVLVDDNIFAFTPTANYLYDVTGLGHYSYGAAKIIPRDANDIVETVVTNPALTITYPTANPTIAVDNIDVTFTVSDFVLGTDGEVKYSIDGGTTATTTASPISFTGLAEGNHTVNLELVDMSGVSLTPAVTANASFTVDIPDAINEVEGNAISIYPNPANEVLYVKNLDKVSEIEIFNVLGQKVENVNISSEINISNLQNGMYIVRFTTNTGNIVSKTFIKK